MTDAVIWMLGAAGVVWVVGVEVRLARLRRPPSNTFDVWVALDADGNLQPRLEPTAPVGLCAWFQRLRCSVQRWLRSNRR